MEKDVEDPGSARAQNAAKFLHALVAVLLWYVVRFFVVYCVCVVYCVFVLWFLCCGMFDVCSSKAVLGVVFLHGEARVTSCWTQGVTHFKKRAGLRMWLNPIASLMLCYWR